MVELTNTYVGASLWVLQKEEVNTTNKVALVLPTKPHSMMCLWLLYISFYLNFDTVLYNPACWYYLKTCYKLSTFKLQTYLQGLLIICRLHIHLYSCVWIIEVQRARGFLKDQEQGRKSTWGSEIHDIRVIYLWFYQAISQPALPESNSVIQITTFNLWTKWRKEQRPWILTTDLWVVLVLC